MADLRVQLYGHHVGTLVGESWRDFDFVAQPSAISHFGLGSPILSHAVPLLPNAVRRHAPRRRNFFDELLPEGPLRTRLAEARRVDPRDTLAMLAEYGRDVAGAVTIWDPTAPGEPRKPYATPVTSAEVRGLLANAAASPLANDIATGKTSLAGVQRKIVLAHTDGAWHQVHDGFPSTHILKPEVPEFPTMIFDEAYGSLLARAVGLSAHATWIEEFDGARALVIERFDRDATAPEGRIHQEDMNQALGASGDQKYQEHGGKVTLKNIASVVRTLTAAESPESLLRQVSFAVAIGNLDMHAKNIGILRHADGTSELAPAYDCVPMRRLPTDGRMALAVGGEYVHAALTRDHIVAEARSWGMRDPERLVTDVLERVRAAATANTPEPGAAATLRADVVVFAERLLAGERAGATAG